MTSKTVDYVCIDSNGVKAPRPHTKAQINQVMLDGSKKLNEGITGFYEVAKTVTVEIPPEV